MNIILENYKAENVKKIAEIWNQVIRDEEGFLWDEEFPEGKVDYVLSQQEATVCAINTESGEVIGFYILHKNNSGRGAHIANAMYAVKKEYRGMGVGKQLSKHSLVKAVELGYEAMQYNTVLSDNIASNNLWKSIGFDRIGIIPNGYKNSLGHYSDLYLYYKAL